MNAEDEEITRIHGVRNMLGGPPSGFTGALILVDCSPFLIQCHTSQSIKLVKYINVFSPID